jgi:glycerol-3-phosphate dehydrogenase
MPGDPPDYPDTWVKACHLAGIPVDEVRVNEARAMEPELSPNLVKAFTVPDASIDPFRLTWRLAQAAREKGAVVLTGWEVTSITQTGDRVAGVLARNRITGEEELFPARIVVSCSGAWAGEIASLARIHLPLSLSQGALLAFNRRLTRRVINRCRPPADNDILVPGGSVSILGTTSVPVAAPRGMPITAEEAQRVLQDGVSCMPGLSDARILRAFSGVRPLFDSGLGPASRATRRTFSVIDHRVRDRLEGLISVVGGKLTTYRLMAERAANLVATRLGASIDGKTATTPVPLPVPGGMPPSAKQAGSVTMLETYSMNDAVICDCERVSRSSITAALSREPELDLDQLRRRTRLGMGTCQGTFCSYRAAGALCSLGRQSPEAVRQLEAMLDARWRGIRPVMWGQQAREAEMTLGVYRSLLGLGHEASPGQDQAPTAFRGGKTHDL